MDKCILVVGSFARGHEFYGPFDSPRVALDYADRNCRRGDYTLAKLEEPDGRNADDEDWSGPDGRTVLLIGDGYNGQSIVGTFDSPESALDYGDHYEVDSDGSHVMWVELQRVE
jgi:hypothetical protein